MTWTGAALSIPLNTQTWDYTAHLALVGYVSQRLRQSHTQGCLHNGGSYSHTPYGAQ